MSLYEWLTLTVYVTVLIPLWRRLTWYIGKGDESHEDDFANGILEGLYISLLWPLWVPFYGLYRAGILRWFPKAARWQQKELELKAREKRIEQMETELGIGQRDD